MAAALESSPWECISPQPEDEQGSETIPCIRYGHSTVLSSDQTELIVSHGYYHSMKDGSVYLQDTWKFQTQTRTWMKVFDTKDHATTTSDNSCCPLPRFKHISVMDDGNKMYLFGGTDGGKRNNKSSYTFGPSAEMCDLWCLDLNNSPLKWRELKGEDQAPMPSHRCDHGAVWAKNRLWIYGGMQGDESGTADRLKALDDLWSWSPQTMKWEQHYIENKENLEFPVARYGHCCIQGKTYNNGGFYILGGRQRDLETGQRNILNDLWWCDILEEQCSDEDGDGSLILSWTQLETPNTSDWQPRFHFSATSSNISYQAFDNDCERDNRIVLDKKKNTPKVYNNERGSFIIYGGNVSTGLLRLPADVWMYSPQTRDISCEQEDKRIGSWKRITQSDDSIKFDQCLPYGRVHSTITFVPRSMSPAQTRGDDAMEAEQARGNLLLYGGESTRPYMYHGSVYQLPLDI